MNTDYTFVSYNGGSAGDLFVTSCNGTKLNKISGISVPTEYSLKKFERKIQDKEMSVEDAVQQLPTPPNGFVSTHLFEPIINGNWKMINVVVTDPQVQEQIVTRQMKLQKLAIKVAPGESWFDIAKTLCVNEKFEKAASYWFEQSKRVWMQTMNNRVANTYGKNINFNFLFKENFVSNLQQQGWTTNIDVLAENHRRWIKKNSEFSKEETLTAIAKKLSTMDWTAESGYIDFVA